MHAAVPRREVDRPLHRQVRHAEHLHAEVRSRRVAQESDEYIAATGSTRRVHARVPALVRDERVRSRVHEDVEGVEVAAHRGEQHGSLPGVRSIVDHRSRRALRGAEQHLHDCLRAALRREVQRGLTVVAHDAHPRALVQQ